jgi:hypothetical protein
VDHTGSDDLPYAGQRTAASFTTDQTPDFYRFAWEMFIYVNQPYDRGLYWESWATVEDVFNPMAKHERIGHSHMDIPQQSIVQLDFIGAQPPENTRGCQKTPEIAEQDVRLNDKTVQYINAYELWNLEGQEKMFQKYQRVSFPLDAVEVKAIWKRSLAEAEKNMYYTRTVSGQLEGLAGLHVMSKRTRNWVWMTFEHVNNNCRCQFIKCYDSFGADPPGGTQPAPTLNLRRLVYRTGMTEQWKRYWRYFRLTGVQTVFVDSAGRPTLLGNSIPEGSLGPSSSCITCHFRSAVSRTGMRLKITDPDHNCESFRGVLTSGGFWTTKGSWHFGD